MIKSGLRVGDLCGFRAAARADYRRRRAGLPPFRGGTGPAMAGGKGVAGACQAGQGGRGGACQGRHGIRTARGKESTGKGEGRTLHGTAAGGPSLPQAGGGGAD